MYFNLLLLKNMANHLSDFTACSAVPLWRVSVFERCSAACGWHQRLSPAGRALGPAGAETRLSTGPGGAETGKARAGPSSS